MENKTIKNSLKIYNVITKLINQKYSVATNCEVFLLLKEKK